MKNGGGHFAPKFGGHFELESDGHFKLELGGQYHWNLHTNCYIFKLLHFCIYHRNSYLSPRISSLVNLKFPLTRFSDIVIYFLLK